MSTIQSIIQEISQLANPSIAQHSTRFFKSGPGEYGEGDCFLGIRVPIIRQQVKRYRGLTLDEVLSLLKNQYHEIRLFAVLMMVDLFERGNEQCRSRVYTAYLNHTKWVNNWDLVDSSAHKIVGAFLESRSRKPLYKLAKSRLMWDKRISIISCYWFIKQKDFTDTLLLSKLLLNDAHDLIHKAVGWMLREVGNRDWQIEDSFLQTNYQNMPRTMLRYSIEKFPQLRKSDYMKGRV